MWVCVCWCVCGCVCVGVCVWGCVCGCVWVCGFACVGMCAVVCEWVCVGVCGYVYTVEPVRLATLVSRPPITFGQIVTDPAHSFDITHGLYSTTWTPVNVNCWPNFHI